MKKIDVVAKKNKFINLKGKGKIKVITKNKTYTADCYNFKGLFLNSERYKVFCDSNYSFFYSKSEFVSLFITLNKNRDNKLNQLGI